MANPIVLNLTADEATDSFALAEPGVYKVEIEEAEFAKSAAGNDMIKLVLKSLEDSYKGKFFANVTLTAAAARFGLIPLMKAIGQEVSAGALTVPGEDELVGKEIAVKVVKAFSYKDGDKWVRITEDKVEEAEKEGHDVKRRNEIKSYVAVGGKAKPSSKAGKKFSL